MRTLYFNGRVLTMDTQQPFADAFVVQGDRFLGVGRDHDLEALLRPGDRRINLAGNTVVPGLIDAHVHFSCFSFGLLDVNLDGIGTLADALELVRKRAQAIPLGTWIRGTGFNPNTWERWPNRFDLDGVALDHPVILTSKDFHTLWTNSMAIRLAGITRETPIPFGGEAERDEHGELTGIFKENAMGLVAGAAPARSHDEHVEAMRLGLRKANQVGVTGVHDMDPVACFSAFQSLHAGGELSVRVFKQIPEAAFESATAAGLKTGFGNEWIRVGCLKLFADGSLGSQTANMLEPFEGGSPDYFGVATHTTEGLRDLIHRAVQSDIAVAIHAIGDAANRTVLDAFDSARELSRVKRLRHRVEHAQLLSRADIPRFAALDLVVSVQPSHAPSDRYVADRFWGSRCQGAYAFRSLLQTGARLAFGSDVPVEPLDPLAGIHSAVWRKRLNEPDSDSWYPDQCLTLMEALHGFTMGAAYASGEESAKGSIQAGKLADFVVLSHDITQGDEETLGLVRPDVTVVGGKVCFGYL